MFGIIILFQIKEDLFVTYQNYHLEQDVFVKHGYPWQHQNQNLENSLGPTF